MEHLLSLIGILDKYTVHITVLLIILMLIIAYVHDVMQKQDTILRNYPVIGHIRYIAQDLGVYLRQYFYSRDREELPFNRDQREWVYHAAENVDTTIGFGSTRDLRPPGTILFVDAPFPVLGTNVVETRPITFGPQTKNPYSAKSILNISAMSYGALSHNTG